MNTVTQEVLEVSPGQSFLVRKFNEIAFKAPFHSHPEYELTYILEGSGRRYVGSHVSNFQKGDLVLLGPNLPHCWKLDAVEPSKVKAETIVVQFANDFLGNAILAKPEFFSIKNLLYKKSSGGLLYKTGTTQNIRAQIQALYEEERPFNRLIQLLQILQHLAHASDFDWLNHQDPLLVKTPKHKGRIEKVYAYIIENFKEDIALEDIADLVSMTPQSFCKYFKKMTRHTFMEMVIKYRLDYAARQLSRTQKSVTSICFESGFKDLSYFCKKFKEKTKYTPSRYRKAFDAL